MAESLEMGREESSNIHRGARRGSSLRRRPILSLIVATLSLAVVPELLSLRGTKDLDSVGSYSTRVQPHSATEIQLEPGDLVFRRGTDMASRVVLAVDRASIFSHVGLVARTDSGLRVIHAIPAESRDEADVVKADPPDVFLDATRARAFAIFRVRRDAAKAPTAVGQAAALAAGWADRQIPFDFSFDMETQDRLYCTELVYRAFLEVGIDLLDAPTGGIAESLSSRFLLPSALAGSGKLALIAATSGDAP